jgi:DNA-directed RNA polymerase specialized sigma24 family protein
MTPVQRQFERFFAEVEPRLRAALVARYGPSTGRAATVDALSYAWEHWERLSRTDNPVGYLFRVGQSASRSYAAVELPWQDISPATHRDSQFVPELVPALASLPEQQRVVVVLVHGLGWTHRDAAEMLEVSPSTIQTHVERALASLRAAMEVTDA